MDQWVKEELKNFQVKFTQDYKASMKILVIGFPVLATFSKKIQRAIYRDINFFTKVSNYRINRSRS